MDDNTVAFTMAKRLTHENLKSNPQTADLFAEKEQKYRSKRAYLGKNSGKHPDMITRICRRCDYSRYESGNRHVDYFGSVKVLPLIGSF